MTYINVSTSASVSAVALYCLFYLLMIFNFTSYHLKQPGITHNVPYGSDFPRVLYRKLPFSSNWFEQSFSCLGCLGDNHMIRSRGQYRNIAFFTLLLCCYPWSMFQKKNTIENKNLTLVQEVLHFTTFYVVVCVSLSVSKRTQRRTSQT